MTRERSTPSRRSLLAAAGAAAAGLAGCTGLDGLTGEPCPPYEPAGVTATAWRGEHGPASGAGTVASGAVPEGPLELDWTAPVETPVGHTVPVVADGTVYLHDADDELWALDAATGDRQWRVELADPTTTPALADGILVVRTETDTRAVAAASGERLWERSDLGSGVLDASPVVAGDRAYLAGGVAVHAVDLATGETRWRVATGLPTPATPAVAGDTVYVAGSDTYVRALAAADGSERWRVKTDTRIGCDLAVGGGVVLVGTPDGEVLALEAATGAERWRRRLEAERAGGAAGAVEALATDGSRAYAATSGSLTALALGDGTPCWGENSYDVSYAGGIAVGDGRVFGSIQSREGSLGVLDAATGELRQAFGPSGGPVLDIGPSIAGGAVYAAGDNRVARFR